MLLIEGDDVSLSYTKLSSMPKYKNKLVFSVFRKPSQDFLNYLGIKSIPKLVALNLNNESREVSDFNSLNTTEFNSDFTYKNLEGFANFVS